MFGKAGSAMRLYVTRLAVLMSIYLACLYLAVSLFRHGHPTGVVAYALAIAPALPIIGIFWAVMRLIIEETDEYVRMLHVRRALFGTGFCLSIATTWDLLQDFGLVAGGHNGLVAAFVWFVGFGLGDFYNRLTLGHGTCA